MKKIWEIVKYILGIVILIWVVCAADGYYVKKTGNKSVLSVAKKEVVEFIKCGNEGVQDLTE